MANIGLTNIWFSNLTEAADGTPSYDGAKNLGKAVSCSVEITNNEATLYGDDALAESDTSFASGSITLGVTDDNDTIFAPLLGHEIDGEGEVIKTSTDVAPYVGVGRIVTKMVNGAYKYKVEFLYKCKFSEPSKDENTKGESIEFSTPSVEGVVAALGDVNGTWSKSKTFDTKSDALTYLQGLMSADAETPSVRITNVQGQGVDSVSIVEGQGGTTAFLSVVVPNGSTVTWTIGDPDVATVSGGASSVEGSGCSVTGVDAGETTLTASITVDGRTYTDTCAITVTES